MRSIDSEVTLILSSWQLAWFLCFVCIFFKALNLFTVQFRRCQQSLFSLLACYSHGSYNQAVSKSPLATERYLFCYDHYEKGKSQFPPAFYTQFQSAAAYTFYLKFFQRFPQGNIIPFLRLKTHHIQNVSQILAKRLPMRKLSDQLYLSVLSFTSVADMNAPKI